jgi:hypothetical protein
MKLRAFCLSILALLITPSVLLAQGIAPSFEEDLIQPCADGRWYIQPDPDHGDLPSLDLYVIATGLTRLFGYEYNLSLSNEAGLGFKSFTYYPSSGLNFGSDPGDVRVGTGECFWAGEAEAGPNPEQIRLTKYRFTWLTVPTENVEFCVGPTYISGAMTPQYTECVALPTPLPLKLLDTGYGSDWTNCAFALFDYAGYEDFTFSCNVVGVQSRSWGALKSAY